MTNKQNILDIMIVNTEMGIAFLENYSSNYIDIGYARPYRIILSYSFELLLKAVWLNSLDIVIDDKKFPECLFKMVGHNFNKICNKIGKANLEAIGVKSCKFNKNKTGDIYKIEMCNGDIIEIEDFTDIRYDFIGNKKDRPIKQIDKKKIDNILKHMNRILEIIKTRTKSVE